MFFLISLCICIYLLLFSKSDPVLIDSDVDSAFRQYMLAC